MKRSMSGSYDDFGGREYDENLDRAAKTRNFRKWKRQQMYGDGTPEQYKTPEFKRLRSEWYKKLTADGFEDIEREDGSLRETWEVNGDPAASYARRETRLAAGMEEEAPLFMLGEQWLNTEVWETRGKRWHFSAVMSGSTIRSVFDKHPLKPEVVTYNGFVNQMAAVRNAMLRALEQEINDEEGIEA